MTSQRAKRRTLLATHRNKVYARDHGLGFLARLMRAGKPVGGRKQKETK